MNAKSRMKLYDFAFRSYEAEAATLRAEADVEKKALKAEFAKPLNVYCKYTKVCGSVI